MERIPPDELLGLEMITYVFMFFFLGLSALLIFKVLKVFIQYILEKLYDHVMMSQGRFSGVTKSAEESLKEHGTIKNKRYKKS